MRLFKKKITGIYHLDLRAEGGEHISLNTKNKKEAEELAAQKVAEHHKINRTRNKEAKDFYCSKDLEVT